MSTSSCPARCGTPSPVEFFTKVGSLLEFSDGKVARFPALQRAADTYHPAAGINLILAGVRTQAITTSTPRNRR